jgi:predicted nucleic acid-binding protein
MVRALFDTNILIVHLNHVSAARAELTRHGPPSISIVTWIEVMVGASPNTDAGTQAFLNRFSVIALDHKVAERAVELRRQHKIKLPDAIIWATAQVHAMLLVTRNAKDFPASDVGIRVPYKI